MASGIDVVLGHPFYTMGSETVTDHLLDGLQDSVGAKFHYISGAEKAVETICEHIEAKRDALGINKKTERKMFDMKDRRKAHV